MPLLVLPFIFSLVFVIDALNTTSSPWTVQKMPNPRTNPMECGRPSDLSSSRICDPDHVLNGTEANAIDEMLFKIYWTDPSYDGCGSDVGRLGYEVALCIAREIDPQGMGSISTAGASRTFAEFLLRIGWKIGPPPPTNEETSCDAYGLVILLISGEKRIDFAFGNGLKNRLTDDRINYLLNQTHENLRNNGTFYALSKCIEIIAGYLHGPPVTSPQNLLGLFIFEACDGAVLCWLMWWIYVLYRRGRCESKCGLIKLERARLAAFSTPESRRGAVSSFSCPYCLERFCRPATKLACGHKFCTTCLLRCNQRLSSHKRPTKLHGRLDQRQRENLLNFCPICQCPFHPASSLPQPNFLPSSVQSGAQGLSSAFRGTELSPIPSQPSYVGAVMIHVGSSSSSINQSDYPTTIAIMDSIEGTSTQSSATNATAVSDILFRLQRLHEQFPRLITEELVKEWIASDVDPSLPKWTCRSCCRNCCCPP